MGMLNIPKAVYKAQQAKNKMSKIEAAGKDEAVIIVLNGLNEITNVDFDVDELKNTFKSSDISDIDLEALMKKLSKNIKKSFQDAKKQIEKELISSTSIDDLKNLLG